MRNEEWARVERRFFKKKREEKKKERKKERNVSVQWQAISTE